MLDRNSVLGQLSDSVAGYDLHDLVELPAFGAPFLTIVFPHADWGEQAGSYASDFHPFRSCPRSSWSTVGDEWYSEVRSDDPTREVTLRWEGEKKRMKGMWLEDLLTEERIRAETDGELQTHTFFMEGRYWRSFRWGFGGPNPDFRQPEPPQPFWIDLPLSPLQGGLGEPPSPNPDPR